MNCWCLQNLTDFKTAITAIDLIRRADECSTDNRVFGTIRLLLFTYNPRMISSYFNCNNSLHLEIPFNWNWELLLGILGSSWYQFTCLEIISCHSKQLKTSHEVLPSKDYLSWDTTLDHCDHGPSFSYFRSSLVLKCNIIMHLPCRGKLEAIKLANGVLFQKYYTKPLEIIPVCHHPLAAVAVGRIKPRSQGPSNSNNHKLIYPPLWCKTWLRLLLIMPSELVTLG